MAKAATSPTPPSDSDIKDFTTWATSPAAWLAHAEQLQQSSELLWQRIAGLFDLQGRPSSQPGTDTSSLHAPAYLLVAGFALEAMLKAAAIQVALNTGGIDSVVAPGPVPVLRGWVKTHKLEALAARAGVTYTGEQLTYLERFERYITWAGRYPVPLSPPSASAPHGFGHYVGTQDRRVFSEILDRARTAYRDARNAPGAWSESTDVGDYRQRKAAWMSTCTDWLRVVRPVLVDHNLQVAAGDRGVLCVQIDTADMRQQLTPPLALVQIDPSWMPLDEFLPLFGSAEGVGADTAARWGQDLTTMDPSRDVALFLFSTPDADGRWFSRYIFFRAGEVDADGPPRVDQT